MLKLTFLKCSAVMLQRKQEHKKRLVFPEQVKPKLSSVGSSPFEGEVLLASLELCELTL